MAYCGVKAEMRNMLNEANGEEKALSIDSQYENTTSLVYGSSVRNGYRNET